MSHKVVCTAGHIDHGKTALVKALTGMDTDCLGEEILRGITIDLGFAFYGDNVTIIDLPGHERFIRNMVAGAATVDCALLIVAADDGPMPQTREHLDILNLLGINNGMTIVTKTDLVEEEWLELVITETRNITEGTFLERAPILTVDSLSGAGIDEFKRTFDRTLSCLPPRTARPEFRQPVDRSFTIKGFGAVVTGTIISGRVSLKQTLEHLPAGRLVKVRGIQVHGKDVDSAEAGARAALNITSVEKNEIARGDVLAEPGLLRPSVRFDCIVELLNSSQPLKHRQRLRFHIGTAEIIGRILLLEGNILNPGESTFAQLELEKPAMALRGDRFVFRTYSPQITTGGGTILTAAEEKHKRRQKPLLQLLNALAQDDESEIVLRILADAGGTGMTSNNILSKTGFIYADFQDLMRGLVDKGKVIEKASGGSVWYITPQASEENLRIILQAVKKFHQENPAKPGFTLAELKGETGFPDGSPFLEYALDLMMKADEIKRTGSLYALPSHKIKLDTRQRQLADLMIEIIESAGLSAPKAHPIADRLKADVNEILDLMAILESLGNIVRLDRDTVISREVCDNAAEKIRRLAEEKAVILLPDAIQVLNASRRVTVAFLEYLDKVGITKRYGDERRLKS